MPKPTKVAHERITQLFDSLEQRVFTQSELRELLQQNARSIKFPSRVGFREFISYLKEYLHLSEIAFDAKKYPAFTRYVWRDATAFQLALSLRTNSFLSHGTAAYLHRLLPRSDILYLNKEQSYKETEAELTQKGIDRAFSNRQRVSRYLVEGGNSRILLLNGKFTDRLGVTKISGPNSEPLLATDLERTLIDLAVRPIYAGGVANVLNAFRAARQGVSAKKMHDYLNRLEYVYPYHQVLGFYLSRAEFPEAALSPFRALGLKYKFYIDYHMPKRIFDESWKLYHPPGLQ